MDTSKARDLHRLANVQNCLATDREVMQIKLIHVARLHLLQPTLSLVVGANLSKYEAEIYYLNWALPSLLYI